MKLRHRYLLSTAALGALLALIAGASWTTTRPGRAAPLLSALEPDAVPAGSPAFTLTVKGAFFTSGSVVRWNGEERPTTVVSASVLRAGIGAGDVGERGTALVSVVAPDSAGDDPKVSNALAFRIGPSSKF